MTLRTKQLWAIVTRYMGQPEPELREFTEKIETMKPNLQKNGKMDMTVKKTCGGFLVIVLLRSFLATRSSGPLFHRKG